jgi:hypothetical protein
VRRSRTFASLGALAVSATLMTPTSALSVESAATAAPTAAPPGDDTFEPGNRIEDYPVAGLSRGENQELKEEVKQEQVDVAERARQRARERLRERGGPTVDLPESNPAPEPARDYTADPLVGQTKTWLALDNAEGIYYLKEYRLAAVGDHLEVWVAVGENASYDEDRAVYTLPFPEGDCRNTTYDGARVEITPEQLNGLVADFDLNIYPLETEAFRTPPDRGGEEATLPGELDLPDDYYATEGGADRTVTLIDNVRDSNYYTPPDEEQLSYIAGFFSAQLNTFYDRNTMTVDAWDWLHRTGPNPPDDSSEDPCLNAPERPFLYEGTFAHEWQHLLQSYTGEVTWLNEGLSDWAQTLTGYTDPSLPITDPEYDSHIQCFYGYLAEQYPTNLIPREDAGPENSLTWWEDQGFDEILCDYGAAYTMLEYLVGQFGVDAATFLHLDEATGLSSVANLLGEEGDDRTAMDILHDWAAMIALDGALDDNLGLLLRFDDDRVRTPTLDASVRWEGDDAYDTPGAPPNGSDYVRLRDGSDDYYDVRDLRTVEFTGAEQYEPAVVEWTVDDTSGDEVDDEALYSGSGDSLDRTMAFAATVPADDPTLTFATRYDIEFGWDFGFVQVSTDGGQTWESVADELTTTEHAENPSYPEIAAQLPGLTGTSALTESGEATFTQNEGPPEWVTADFDLSAYAGDEVLIGFRYMTDGAAVLPGWWVDDITLGDELINDGSTTEGLRSYNEINPDEVAGWTLQLVSIDPDGRRPAVLRRYDVEPGETLRLSRRDLIRLLPGNELVGAIVTHDEPTESVLQYATYTLEVNGVVQPGGG